MLFIMPQFYCHASCPGWTPAVYGFCKWSPKSRHFITFTGVEMKAYSKVQAGRDGCYFLLNSFTANDIFVEWHPPCKQPKANRKEWLVMQLWLNTVLSYHQVVWRFNRNIWKKIIILIFRAIFMYNRKWLLDFYCSNVVLTCSYTLDPLTI